MRVTINHCICLDPMVIFVRVPVSTFISGTVCVALIQSNWFVCHCNAILIPVLLEHFYNTNLPLLFFQTLTTKLICAIRSKLKGMMIYSKEGIVRTYMFKFIQLNLIITTYTLHWITPLWNHSGRGVVNFKIPCPLTVVCVWGGGKISTCHLICCSCWNSFLNTIVNCSGGLTLKSWPPLLWREL